MLLRARGPRRYAGAEWGRRGSPTWRPSTRTSPPARRTVSKVEYYFTLSPVMPLYLFERHKDIGILNYLDSDLYFMSSPKPLYDELGGKSLLIVEHRFPRRLKRLERCGRFNVQFQLYRNDEAARGCLRWWRGKCLEWCRDQVDRS
jgi:hypothetical protein